MVGLSPRLALLALLEVPLIITARKVYDARHQVTVGTGWAGGDGTGWDSGDQGGGMGGMEMMRTVGKGWWDEGGGDRMGRWGRDGDQEHGMVGTGWDGRVGTGWDGGDGDGGNGNGGDVTG